MSDETTAALHEAIAAHKTVQAEVAAAGQDPESADRSDLEAAARAHLDDIDPGYFSRADRVREEFGITLEPHQRKVAPQLQEQYWQAVADRDEHPDDPELRQRVSDIEHELANASIARRAAEGRKFAANAGG